MCVWMMTKMKNALRQFTHLGMKMFSEGQRVGNEDKQLPSRKRCDVKKASIILLW